MRTHEGRTIRRELSQEQQRESPGNSLGQGILHWIELPLPDFLKPVAISDKTSHLELHREQLSDYSTSHTLFRLHDDPADIFSRAVDLPYSTSTAAALRLKFGRNLDRIANEELESDSKSLVVTKTIFLVRLSSTGEYVGRIDHESDTLSLSKRSQTSSDTASRVAAKASDLSVARSDAAQDAGVDESKLWLSVSMQVPAASDLPHCGVYGAGADLNG